MTQDKLSYRNKLRKDERCCGNCCWFKHEDFDGWGTCYKAEELGLQWDVKHCSGNPCKKYISEQTMRHYLAVLIQHNRWRRDNEIPNSRKPVDARELGKAIDFAVDYIKTFMKL